MKMVKGSIKDISIRNRESPAVTFMSADLVVLLDVSASMKSNDARDGQSRHNVARQELELIQNNNEGKVALICFSDTVKFCPNGVPIEARGDTNLVKGLEYIRKIDNSGMKILVVSDGAPNNPDGCIRVAKTFLTTINTIFIGPESDTRGRDFMIRLASATGGQNIKSEEVGSLQSGAILLLAG